MGIAVRRRQQYMSQMHERGEPAGGNQTFAEAMRAEAFLYAQNRSDRLI